MFYPLSKHLQFRQKYSSARRIFTLFSVFGYPYETPSLVFDRFIYIKLSFKAHSDWLQQRNLSEDIARVDDDKPAFEF